MNQTTDLFAQTSQSSVQSSWQVYGASSIGKSHIDSNLPNQDSIYLQKTQDGIAAVVCDGAGSAKFSQAGAAFFSQSITLFYNKSNISICPLISSFFSSAKNLQAM